jgi:hypothetical protein
MHFHIGKFGGGCLRSAKDVVRLFEVLGILNINIVVVSVFGGITNLLERIVEEKSLALFLHEFIYFHEAIAKELGLEDSLQSYFALQTKKFEGLFSQLCNIEKDPNSFPEIYAEIVAMGEDFSQKIVLEYVRSVAPKRVNVLRLDSRKIVSVLPSPLVGAIIDQELSVALINDQIEATKQPFIVVVQGLVAGAYLPTNPKTALLERDGGDVTAALIAASLTTESKQARLTYVKSFMEKALSPDKDSDNDSLASQIFKRRKKTKWKEGDVLKGQIGIRDFARYMKETGRIVVSLKVLKIKGTPTYFQVVDFWRTDVTLTVALEPVIVRMLLDQLDADPM